MMATSTQANFDTVKDADAHAQGIDGGLNLKTDASRLAPPATTRADNGWYINPGNVQQLPGFASQMQADTRHVYNLHARDLQQPANKGDVMVHGEVLDSSGSLFNKFTTPCWSDGAGATYNRQQPMPPWNLRTKVLTGRHNLASRVNRYNITALRQEAGFSDANPQRYAVVYSTGQSLFATFGILDGQVETGDVINGIPFSSDYAEFAGVQGANYWTCVSLKNNTLTYTNYDWTGAQVGTGTVSTTCAPYNNNAVATAGTSAPFTVFHHAGRTWVGFINAVSASNYVFTMHDLLTGVQMTAGISSTTFPTQGFAVASPYTHVNPAGNPIYFSVLFNGAVYVCQHTTPGSIPTVVCSPITMAVAPDMGYRPAASATGRVDWTATLAMCIFDGDDAGDVGTGTGTGLNAKFGITCFRHYPEVISTGTTTWYQSVSASCFSFRGSLLSVTTPGVLSWISQNVVRMPSGMALCSKAFSYNPPEAQFAGPTCAKNAYALVRCGPVEPQSGLGAPYLGPNGTAFDWTYGQPTYFIIDNLGRIVSRAFESQAVAQNFADDDYSLVSQGPFGSTPFNPYASSTYYYSLGAPLIIPSKSDTSCVDIILPAWTITNSAQAPTFQLRSTGLLLYAVPPTNVTHQPGALVLTVSAQSAQCPPVQAGQYSVLSGPMTCVHDGRGVVEANYHFGVFNLFSTSAGTPALTVGPGGIYYYVAVWEWQDALGRVHRSQPSVPYGISMPTGFTNPTLNVYGPVSVKASVGSTLVCRLYRSLVNNTSGIYYLVGTQNITPFSNTSPYIFMSDNASVDPQGTSYASAGITQLDKQPRIYFQQVNNAGLVPFLTTQPPAFYWQVGAKGRAFGVSQNFGQNRLYYSSVAQDRFPYEWNTNNYVSIPPDIGDVRSIEAIDDKIVILGTRSNAIMNGDGPANGGAQPTDGSAVAPAPNDGFSQVQPIPTPVGVLGTGSPARIPDGIVFQGYSGVQLVGRDITVQPIGAAVDNFTGRQINNAGVVLGRATTLATLQSVVWCNPQGPALVYNYLTQKWSTWPLLANAVAMVQRLDGSIAVALQPIVGGKYAGPATLTVPGADLGTLGATHTPTCRVNDAFPGLVLETPWILPSGESGGEAKLWDVTITGSYIGPHVLQIEQAYDYIAQYVSTTQFNVTKNPGIYQYRVRPKGGARHWAVRYRVTLLPSPTLSSAYLMATLGDLVLNYGSNQGTSRLSAAASG